MIYGIQVNAAGQITARFCGPKLDPKFREVTAAQWAQAVPGSILHNGTITSPSSEAAPHQAPLSASSSP